MFISSFRDFASDYVCNGNDNEPKSRKRHRVSESVHAHDPFFRFIERKSCLLADVQPSSKCCLHIIFVTSDTTTYFIRIIEDFLKTLEFLVNLKFKGRTISHTGFTREINRC